MHDSSTIANLFLSLAENAGDTVTPMQLQKLVYLAHGWNLGLYGTPLIRDEVQAWQYGPVIPSLYQKTREFRSNPVKGPLSGADDRLLTPRDRDIVQQVYRIYGRRSGPELSRLTHEPGSPWDATYQPGRFGLVISNDLVEDFYSTLAQRRQR